MSIEKLNENKEGLSEQEAFQTFWETLREEGWMTDPDGEDHCAECWVKFSLKHDGDFGGDECPTSRIAKSRKIKDGWDVICWGSGNDEKCPNKKEVFVSFEEDKA